MRVIISCNNRSKDFKFTELETFIKSLPPKPSLPFQIQIHHTDSEETVLEHFDLESVLNRIPYIHYAYVSIKSESLTEIFLLATLIRNFSELFGYEIELFADCSEKFS